MSQNGQGGAERAGDAPTNGTGPITELDVREAIRFLEGKGDRPTQKAIRAYLGRGSFTTINKHLANFQRARLPELPPIELGEGEKHLILGFGAQIFDLVKLELFQVAARREAVLTEAAKLAEERAEDLAAATEAALTEAAKKVEEALGFQNQAVAEAAAGRKRAERAEEEAMRVRGQIEVLAGEKAKLEERLASVEERLQDATIELNIEIERATAARAEAAQFREELAKAQSQVETHRLSLESAGGELREVRAVAAGLEKQVSGLTGALDRAGKVATAEQARRAGLEQELASAYRNIASRDAAIHRLEEAVAAERDRASLAVATLAEQKGEVEALRGVRDSLANFMVKPGKNIRKETGKEGVPEDEKK